jgi:hypothetical protein
MTEPTEQSTEPVGRWISIHDKLPEQERWVVAVYNGRRGQALETLRLSSDGKKKYWLSDDDYFDFECVTHWMPLPELPVI